MISLAGPTVASPAWSVGCEKSGHSNSPNWFHSRRWREVWLLSNNSSEFPRKTGFVCFFCFFCGFLGFQWLRRTVWLNEASVDSRQIGAKSHVCRGVPKKHTGCHGECSVFQGRVHCVYLGRLWYVCALSLLKCLGTLHRAKERKCSISSWKCIPCC